MISTDAPPIPFHVPDRLDVDGFIEDARVILETGRLSLGLHRALRDRPGAMGWRRERDGGLELLGRAHRRAVGHP